MTGTASLPMYQFPTMRQAYSRFWGALTDMLRAEGFSGVPEELAFDQPPVPDEIVPNVLFTQTCGYPLQTIYRDQYRLLATPSYDAPGCGAMSHSAFVVVRADDPAATLEDLRGRRFAVNSIHSNSGMNLPRRLVAPLAREGRFFGEVVHSGSHPRSLEWVRSASADAASVDCLTWAFASDYAPDMIGGLRVLAQTPPSPAIPFITGRDTPADQVAALRRALVKLGSEDAYEGIRKAMRLKSIGLLSAGAYAAIMNYEQEAHALSYAVIA
ncbi:MAG TPA: PhnD/SsuA/transferrin family substrate-binding protein [Novosphingobium sp.]|nr:PhnD/SsuA/transferrin family substrate-binding protein [Novosphingobium sp.]